MLIIALECDAVGCIVCFVPYIHRYVLFSVVLYVLYKQPRGLCGPPKPMYGFAGACMDLPGGKHWKVGFGHSCYIIFNDFETNKFLMTFAMIWESFWRALGELLEI